MGTYVEQMEGVMKEALPSFYENDFIQACERGEVLPGPLLNYIYQDNIYLDHFLPMFTKVLQSYKIETKSLLQFQGDQDTEPHQMMDILAKKVTDIDKVKVVKDWLRATTGYLNHLDESDKKENFISLSALAGCPYVYGYLAERLITDGKMKPDNPFFNWFDFYKGTDGQVTRDLLAALDKEAEKVSEDVRQQGLTAFYQSVQFENDFFAQAMEVEDDKRG